MILYGWLPGRDGVTRVIDRLESWAADAPLTNTSIQINGSP
jgi:hypothetical protein